MITRPRAFWVVGGMLVLVIAASAAPSPLYDLYQHRWHFSTFVLTQVFAAYALGVLASLLLVGRVSDDLGRRPVLLAGLGGLIASTVAFMLADAVGVLIAARAAQGLATGLVLGVVGAAMLDFRGRHDAQFVGLANGVLSLCGTVAGTLGCGVLAQFVPAPLVIPFVVLLAIEVPLVLLAIALPEPVVERRRPRLRPQPPGVPAAIRGHFALSALGTLASWSVLGIFLGLGAKIASELTGTESPLFAGAVIALIATFGGIAQVAVQGFEPRRVTVVGSAVLAIGLSLNAAVLSTGSAALFLATAAVVGLGFGATFVGALRALTSVVPDHRRAEVMSAFYVVGYLAWAVPALAVGLLTAELGLFPTFRVFTAAVAAACIGVALLARRVRTEPPAVAV